MRKLTCAFCISFFVLLSPLAYSEASILWELEKENSDINLAVYTREVPGSDLKAFKGEILVNANLSTVVAMLLDTKATTEWLYQCEVFELIESTDAQNVIIYLTNTAPWPVSDRDLIMSSSMVQDPETLIVHTDIKAMKGYWPESDDYVRIPEMVGSWDFIPKGESQVLIRYQVHADPGGMLPTWLANSVVVDAPFHTLSNISEMLKREKYQTAEVSFITNK